MKLSRFKLVPVINSMSTTPVSTAGTRGQHDEREPDGLEIRSEKQQYNEDGEGEANAQVAEDLPHGADLPAHL